MSGFKRKDKKEPDPKRPKKPWLDPNYDGLRHDKKRISPGSDEEKFEATCHVARQMKDNFGWQVWMNGFIDEYGNNRPYQKGLVT